MRKTIKINMITVSWSTFETDLYNCPGYTRAGFYSFHENVQFGFYSSPE
jgi:hypothetical protein